MTYVASAMLISNDVYACDEKCQKKVTKTATRYEKDIVKAESKSCVVGKKKISTVKKTCAKAIKSLDKKHSRFKDEIKGHADIQTLKKRHDKLNGVLAEIEEQLALKDTTKKFNNAINKMRSYCTQRSNGGQHQCFGQGDIAKKEYSGFSTDVKSKGVVKKLYKEYQDLMAQGQSLEQQTADMREAGIKQGEARTKFDDDRSAIRETIIALTKGKKNEGDKVQKFKVISEQNEKSNEFKNNCNGEFKLLDSGSVGEDRVKVCELFQNYEKYVAQFKAATSKKHYEDSVHTLSYSVNNLKENGSIYYKQYDTFMLEFKEYKKQMAEDTKYAKVDLSKFDDIYEDFEGARDAALSKNDWDDMIHEEMHSGFESDLKAIAQRAGLKFIKGGYHKKDWKVSKNSLGVPLHKSRSGYAMMKHSKESEERLYHVRFLREYAGGGTYEEASRAKMEWYVIPIED